VYRNGVAYFERYADVEGDALHLQVPADKVDDFLKSLTVSDALTNAPEPIVYPTDIPSSGAGVVEMKIQLSGPKQHKLKLTYVTESPSWKPSYRFTLGNNGKIQVQAWAIVDNTSGEDWKAVKLGVGASSAMSFRFDLRHIRVVERETLRADDLFAQAPPLGGASYGSQQGPVMKNVLAELDDASLSAGPQPIMPEQMEMAPAAGKPQSRLVDRRYKGLSPKAAAEAPADYDKSALESVARHSQNQQNIDQLTLTLKKTQGQIVVEGYANKEDKDKMAASLDRANRAREALIHNGIEPGRVVAMGRGEQAGKNGGVRVLEVPGGPKVAEPMGSKDTKGPAASNDPIGTSHFESESPMTVPRGTSAMVSILNTLAEGEVVYLYDPESHRGNTEFPFRSVRLKNPTNCALESGPVTVFGDGRFIGEGLSEPIPAHAQAFVPFALDRQIVIEHKSNERDSIRRVITVQRGVFHTELQHVRLTTLTLHNRLAEKAMVYVKHTVPAGYTLAKRNVANERLGEAYLFRVSLEPNAKTDLVIEESTPVFATTDIRSPEGMGLIRAYLSSAAVEGPLKKQVDDLLHLNTEMANIEQRIASTRDQMAEYRTRMDELHAQIVTLRAVKMTSGSLLVNLEKKLGDISDKLSKATVSVVSLQEQLMVARIRFQDGVADLSLETKGERAESSPK
jgi:outer membrane protein OmpA-like peptidoglycan-associated protein